MDRTRVHLNGDRHHMGVEKTVYQTMQRPEVEAIVPRGVRRVLDVGCGAGNLGAALKRRDRETHVTGIEMSPDLAQMAKTRVDEVLVGTVEKHLAHLPDGYFDCVIFADVLEHMISPHQVLAAMRQKLEPGSGVIVASIPNVRHWLVLKELVWHGRWDYSQRGLLDSGHLRFFTLATIEEMFRWAGYRIHLTDATFVAPRMIWWIDRLLSGRVQPLMAYQYLLVAHPIPDAGIQETVWWENGRNL